MPLSRHLLQIMGRNKFSIRFESLCWILRVSSRTQLSQNQAKSNYKDCSFGNRDSFVKGTRWSVLILAKSQAGRKFEVLEAACLVSIYIFIEWVKLQVSKTAPRSFKSTNQADNNIHYHSVHVSKRFIWLSSVQKALIIVFKKSFVHNRSGH